MELSRLFSIVFSLKLYSFWYHYYSTADLIVVIVCYSRNLSLRMIRMEVVLRGVPVYPRYHRIVRQQVLM